MARLLEEKAIAHHLDLAGVWSFLPYERGGEPSTGRLRLKKAVRVLLIPLADVSSLVLALVGAYFLSGSLIDNPRFEALLGYPLDPLNLRVFWIGLAAIPLWLLIFHLYGVYRREAKRLSVSTFDELPQTIGAVAVGAWITFSFAMLSLRGAHDTSSIWVFVAVAWLLLMLMLPLGRVVVRIGLSFHNPFRAATLVVGAGDVGRSLIGRLGRHKEYGLKVIGFLDTDPRVDAGESGVIQLLGRPSDLQRIVGQFGVSRVIVAFSRTPHPQLLEVIHQCQELKIGVSVIPRLFEALSSRAEIEDVEGLPVVTLPGYSRHGLAMRLAKRFLDLSLASLAVLILSPLLLLTAIAIKLDSPGPLLYRQARTGKDDRRFLVYKFRSMRSGADAERDELAVRSNDASGPIFKMKDDPRITRVGRLIRRTSIDELPQLINVFRGEMSLVGPRPLPVQEAEACQGTAAMRHQVQPGITGLWQILGRSDIPFEEMMQLDYLYVTNWTLRWDMKIILRTCIAIVRKRGAY